MRCLMYKTLTYGRLGRVLTSFEFTKKVTPEFTVFHNAEHDALIGEKLARILTGGDLNHPTRVSEQYLLDLEREAFLSLCGERKTQERIAHMLKTGKPLRN